MKFVTIVTVRFVVRVNLNHKLKKTFPCIRIGKKIYKYYNTRKNQRLGLNTHARTHTYIYIYI